MLKILIADDHRVVREGLKKIIDQTPAMHVVAEASDGHEVLRLASRVVLDVVLLDISMPGPSGLDILKQLKSRHPRLPVLMLSQHPEDHYAVRALRAGASGYVTKESASDELIAAIQKVAEGHKYVTETLADKMVSVLDDGSDKFVHESLSDREYEILCHFGEGKTVTEIAEILCLSVKTVSTYRTRILTKMNLTKTAELVLYAIQHGLNPSNPPLSPSRRTTVSVRRRPVRK